MSVSYSEARTAICKGDYVSLLPSHIGRWAPGMQTEVTLTKELHVTTKGPNKNFYTKMEVVLGEEPQFRALSNLPCRIRSIYC